MPVGLLFDLTDSYTIPINSFLAVPAAAAIAALLAFTPGKGVAAMDEAGSYWLFLVYQSQAGMGHGLLSWGSGHAH